MRIFKSNRPWGNFIQYCQNENTTVKIITVEPDGELSQQFHQLRDELWVALDPGLQAIIGPDHSPQIITLQPGNELYIKRGTIHTIYNYLDAPARFLEISFGEFDEEDITRLSDKYGRK